MNVLLIILVAAVALVIFICVRQALLVSAFADNSFVMSVAVTVLCILGMFRHVGGVRQGAVATPLGDEGMSGMLLLPYAALGISIVFILLLVALARIVDPTSKRLSRRGKSSSDHRTQDHLAENPDGSKSSRRRVKRSRVSSICKKL